MVETISATKYVPIRIHFGHQTAHTEYIYFLRILRLLQHLFRTSIPSVAYVIRHLFAF